MQIYWNKKWSDSPAVNVDLNSYNSPQVRDSLIFGRKYFKNLTLANARILDIGGGTGKAARFFGLQEYGNELHIADISDEAVGLAIAAGAMGCQVNIETTSLPYPDNWFDVVICMEVIEHLMQPDRLLHDAFRVLKPSGLLYLTTPNLTSLADRVHLLLGHKPLCMSWDPSHIRFYRFVELRQELETHGFVVRQMMTQGVYLPVRLLRRWAYIRVPLLERFRRTLGQHIILTAIKPCISTPEAQVFSL